MALTGKIFDKHGRMKHDDLYHDSGSAMCDECGKWVLNLDEHKAIFHPKYRDEKLDQKTPLTVMAKKALSPEQQSLEPKPGESGETFDKEER